MTPSSSVSPTFISGHSLRYRIWLVVQLARRDIQSRYKGMGLGWVWVLLSPMLMLGVYTFAFKYIFKVRWPGSGDSPIEFALHIFAGLLLFQAAAECWSRSPRLIVDHPHLVKKVRFPLALLPWAPAVNATFHAGVSLLLLVLVASVLGHKPQLQWLLLPLVLIPLIVLLWGVSLLLASLGVFIRDLTQLVTLSIGLLQFLSPVFYPLSALPPLAQQLLGWNPLTVFIEQARALLFDGHTPSMQLWGQSMLVSGVMVLLACVVFSRVRPGFADVI